jgi:hypothetical protein
MDGKYDASLLFRSLLTHVLSKRPRLCWRFVVDFPSVEKPVVRCRIQARFLFILRFVTSIASSVHPYNLPLPKCFSYQCSSRFPSNLNERSLSDFLFHGPCGAHIDENEARRVYMGPQDISFNLSPDCKRLTNRKKKWCPHSASFNFVSSRKQIVGPRGPKY